MSTRVNPTLRPFNQPFRVLAILAVRNVAQLLFFSNDVAFFTISRKDVAQELFARDQAHVFDFTETNV